METIDFSQSFLTFRIDLDKKPPQTVSHKPPYSLNNARVQLDCVCRVTEKASHTTQTYALGASCKTERVGVERNIWTEPNADFVPIFSLDQFMNIKTFSRAGVEVQRYPASLGTQSDRQSDWNANTFDDWRIDICPCSGRLLKTAAEIVDATLSNKRLVAHTIVQNERYECLIEYPVKTINANERDMIYQTDTGPILLPNMNCDPESIISQWELAYSAFNCPEWIEMIVRAPTNIAPGVNVYHYSESLRLDAENRIVCLP
ncbi:MAG: hypothetical protein MK165_15625 [Pirellulaceae bacterium]|nr:hypothetical protein [Pirellulaceae bacterium]